MRFQYGKSAVYGWCVYDTELGNIPAYYACTELLAPLKGGNYPSPTLLQSEYAAMRLCSQLNRAAKQI